MQISEKVKPHPVVVTLLTKVEDIIPKWKIVPTKDIIDSTFKDPVKREKVTKTLGSFYGICSMHVDGVHMIFSHLKKTLISLTYSLLKIILVQNI